MYRNKIFDSKFTFYRAKSCSQNDLVLSNCIDTISAFKILDNNLYSDHCPTFTTCFITVGTSMEFISKCSNGICNDGHINKRKLVPLNLSKINWTVAIPELIEHSHSIEREIHNGTTNDRVNALICSTIYDVCKKHYIKNNIIPIQHPNAINCTSTNYNAIAEMNLHTYKQHINNGIPFENCKNFLQRWIDFRQLAINAAYTELNLKINSSWKYAKNNGKKM